MHQQWRAVTSLLCIGKRCLSQHRLWLSVQGVFEVNSISRGWWVRSLLNNNGKCYLSLTGYCYLWQYMYMACTFYATFSFLCDLFSSCNRWRSWWAHEPKETVWKPQPHSHPSLTSCKGKTIVPSLQYVHLCDELHVAPFKSTCLYRASNLVRTRWGLTEWLQTTKERLRSKMMPMVCKPWRIPP